MSMSFRTFFCDSCSFINPSTVIWGEFSYEVRSKFFPVSRDFGWCHSCNSITPVESLPDPETRKALEKDVLEKKRNLSEAKAHSVIKRSLIQKIFRMNVPTDIKEAESEYSYAVDSLKEAKRHLRVFRKYFSKDRLEERLSQPRCLFCGSTECTHLPQGFSAVGSNKRKQPISVGFQHPGCGGNLMLRDSDIRVFMNIPRRFYDIEGHFLRMEDERPRSNPTFNKIFQR